MFVIEIIRGVCLWYSLILNCCRQCLRGFFCCEPLNFEEFKERIGRIELENIMFGLMEAASIWDIIIIIILWDHEDFSRQARVLLFEAIGWPLLIYTVISTTSLVMEFDVIGKIVGAANTAGETAASAACKSAPPSQNNMNPPRPNIMPPSDQDSNRITIP